MLPTPRRRTARFLPALVVVATLAASSTPARGQVTESERAAARQLFHEGDELQRAGRFTEALDKFQRAQQFFSAPTNMLRIAECEAALGRLVESAESYRALVRTPLPPGSPPAFQAAVDQARGELAQVEPRVPRLVVQLQPATAAPQVQIDGQPVPAALLGEPFPLDPGPHKVLLSASGFVSSEQSVVLKERETRSLQVTLQPIAGVTYAPGTAATAPPSPPPPGSSTEAPPPSGELPPGTPPPPPLIADQSPEFVRKRARPSLILGAHLGVEIPAGQIPTPSGDSVDASSLSGSGLAFALDAGVLFARHWYVGLTLEHAGLAAGKTPTSIDATASALSSNTTSAGVVLGFVVNPDRVSFLGELGLQGRWYTLSWTDATNGTQSASYSTAELLIGMGLWIPAGHTFRLVPELTAGLGSFNSPAGSDVSGSAGHGFVMLGLAGLFSIGL
jgi:hypothetical protein